MTYRHSSWSRYEQEASFPDIQQVWIPKPITLVDTRNNVPEGISAISHAALLKNVQGNLCHYSTFEV